jgi:hypothetical protein
MFTKEELNQEKWLDVKDYEGYYKVSSLGRLKKNSYVNYNVFSGSTTIDEKIIEGANKEGYRQALLSKEGKTKFKMIHRLVADCFLKVDNKREFINHKDLVRNNNRVENLEWCTTKENLIHAHKFGTFKMPSGENSVHHKVKDCDILKIKLNINNKTQKELAKEFNVTQSIISRIVNNKRAGYKKM